MEKRASKRVPVALRIKLRYREVDTFVSKFATNISATGIFISSRKPKSAGTQLRFELRLADDSVVIAGRGRVSWVLKYDKSRPKSPHGMGIEFTSLSKGSRELVEKIVERRAEQGLGEDAGIPHAIQEKELAKVASELRVSPRANGTGSDVDESVNTLSQADSLGSGVVELSLDDIDSSSIDLQAVLNRAKILVGSTEIDGELSDLFRVSAAPVAETVDDASNKLAIMLGGSAVQSVRSGGPAKVSPRTPVPDNTPPPFFELLEDEDDQEHAAAVEASPTEPVASEQEAVPQEIETSEQETAPLPSEIEREASGQEAEAVPQEIETSEQETAPLPNEFEQEELTHDLLPGELLVIEDDSSASIELPPPVPTDILAGAIESLEDEEKTAIAPLDSILAGLEQDRDKTPATVLASASRPVEELTQEGSVDYILDEDALNELSVVEVEDDDGLDLPDLPTLS
ncbi:MAG: TIGR02266 family protein [Kofleriaceae bacterium]|nr:TIGR02266 family protein [Kofleriaceae bacterium]